MPQSTYIPVLAALAGLAFTAALGRADASSATAGAIQFSYREVMIPMRDGARLQTVILTPTPQAARLPILLERTPYGVPKEAPHAPPTSMAALARDGYIFVLQDVRGRFKSQGTFALAPVIGRRSSGGVNDVTDAYDTIEWLVTHVPNNNGRVGLWGVSYAGMTA